MQENDATTVEAAPAAVKPKRASKPDPKPLPPYHVVLLDDDHHTYAYVIEMLASVFAHPEEKGYALAKEVDTAGRAIVCTTHKEKAELKRDQIHAFGRDVRMASSAGSMSARIEPAMA
jgi:ATP-dependent Clp protease adaptor protein ClpS